MKADTAEKLAYDLSRANRSAPDPDDVGQPALSVIPEPDAWIPDRDKGRLLILAGDVLYLAGVDEQRIAIQAVPLADAGTDAVSVVFTPGDLRRPGSRAYKRTWSFDLGTGQPIEVVGHGVTRGDAEDDEGEQFARRLARECGWPDLEIE